MAPTIAYPGPPTQRQRGQARHHGGRGQITNHPQQRPSRHHPLARVGPGVNQGRLRQRDPQPLAAQLTATAPARTGTLMAANRKGRSRHGQQPAAHEPLARVSIGEHEQHRLDQQAE